MQAHLFFIFYFGKGKIDDVIQSGQKKRKLCNTAGRLITYLALPLVPSAGCSALFEGKKMCLDSSQKYTSSFRGLKLSFQVT
jgi:hypothetical protein